MELVSEDEVHVLRMDKGNEHYIFMYDRAHLTQALRRLCEWAINPELSFTWYDAARLSHEMRIWK